MQDLPHEYTATAESTATSIVTASIEGTEDLHVAPPASFGGPGDKHSPEETGKREGS